MAITSILENKGGFVEAIVDADPRSGAIANLPVNSIVYFNGQSFQKFGTGANHYSTLNGVKSITGNYTLQNNDNTIIVQNTATITIPTTIQKNKVYKIINNGVGTIVNVVSTLTYRQEQSIAVNRNLNVIGSFIEFYVGSDNFVTCINNKYITNFINCVANVNVDIEHNLGSQYVSLNYVTDTNEVPTTSGFGTSYVTQNTLGQSISLAMANSGNYKFILEDVGNN